MLLLFFHVRFIFILFYYYYTELSLIIFHLLSMVWALCGAYCLYYFTAGERERYDNNFHFTLCLDGVHVTFVNVLLCECVYARNHGLNKNNRNES